MMRRKILLPFLAAGMLVCLATTASAQALPDTNQQTFFTFSATVALPGVTLPAGKYEFRLASSQANRQIVQVFDSKGKIITTTFTVPAIRNDIPDNPEVRFLEAPANLPPAIKTWWYPGTKSGGHEFIYPKAEAQKYAAVNTGVLASSEPRGGDLERLSATTSAAFETEPKEQAVAGSATQGQITEPTTTTVGSVAPVAAAQQPRPAASTSARTALPQTAGTRSVIVLFGLLALAVGLWAAAGRYGFGH